MTNATLNEHTEARPLADSELDAVTGGTKSTTSFLNALAHAYDQALDEAASR